MNYIGSAELARNYGFWNEDEQSKIGRAHIAIAGVGGDGFQLGLKLVRMGVRNVTIADPEVFEPENANRVPGAKRSTYGKHKADVFKSEAMDIHPEVNVRVFREGVHEDNIRDFMEGVTLVFDESELTYPEVGTAIAREARRRGIPNIMVMNIGFAAQVTSFHPNGKFTFEDFIGVPKDASLSDIQGMSVDFARCLPYIPPYLDLSTFTAVKEGASLPSISPGVDIASAIGTVEAFLHIVGSGNNRPSPTWAPRVRLIDGLTGASRVILFPPLSHKVTLGRTVINNYLGRISKSAYRREDRERRAGK